MFWKLTFRYWDPSWPCIWTGDFAHWTDAEWWIFHSNSVRDWLIIAEQLTPVKGASTTANRSSMSLNRYAYTDDVITVYTDMKTCSYWSAVPCQQQMDMHICMPQQLEIKDIPLQTKYNISLLNSVSDCANFINLTFNYISFLKEDKWTQEDEHITITGKHFKMHW